MSRSKVRIFENEAVEELAVLYKRNRSMETFAQICELTHNLLQSIIISEKYADTDDVYHHLYLQIERWIDRWVPGRGHLYAYISASAKNAAVSYVSKESLHRSTVVGTDVPLESFVPGEEEDELSLLPSGDMDKIREELRAIEVRWHEKEIRDALRYCFHAIFDGRCLSVPDKTCVIRYLQHVVVTRNDGTTYQLTPKQAKTLLAYAQGAVRLMFLDSKVVGFTEVDLLKVRYEFSAFNDIEALVGYDGARRLLTFFAGQTVKFPSKKAHQDATTHAGHFDAAIKGKLGEKIKVSKDGEVEICDGSKAARAVAASVGEEVAGHGQGTYPVFDDESMVQVDNLFSGHGEGE